MSGKLKRGWALARMSFSVLREHPELAILPAVSGMMFLLFAGAIVMAAWPMFDSLDQTMDWLAHWHKNKSVGFYAAAFGVIFAMSVVGIFFNVAMIHCSLRALAGERPSIRSGLAAAVSLLPQIVGWALFATTVGLVLNAIHEQLKSYAGIFGSLLGSVLEVSWAVVTYFVLPVLAAEKVGPITALKRSTSILRSKWGESLTGEACFSLLSGLVTLLAVMIVAVGVAITMLKGAAAMAALGPILIGAGVFLFIATMVATQALTTIFQSGVYLYATTGQAPAALDRDLLESAFTQKAKA